jgi:two-component system, cell cycle sensor histidine kinase and response regulator CckA
MNATTTSQQPRVLVVDDNAAIHQDFRKILGPAKIAAQAQLGDLEVALFEKSGPVIGRSEFRVDSAYQGQEALQLVQAALAADDPYVAVFMDIRMPPGWDGVETTERIWQVCSDVQIVLCSAYSDYTWDDFLAKFGHTDNLLILKKPFETVEVLQIAHALTKKWTLAHQARLWMKDLDRLVRERTSELVQANEQLRSSEERFAKAFRTSPMPMAILRCRDHHFIDANERFLAVTGCPPAQLYARPAPEHAFWPESINQKMFVQGGGRRLGNQNCSLRPQSGPVREVVMQAEPIELGDGECLLLIVEDVTDQLRMENQLRQAQKMEAVGRLAAGVAHEFNNILTVIQGHAELLRDERLSRRQINDCSNRVTQASQRAASLTKQLLAFSRQQPVQLKSLNLSTVVQSTQKMLRQLLGERYEIKLDCPEALPPIFADEGNLEQVLINLTLNARDAMPGGGRIQFATRAVTFTAVEAGRHPEARPGDFVALIVSDTGCGISPEHLRRIFDPFFTTKDIGKGTGLGLSTIHGIVRQHRGWVETDSLLGQGTTFSIYLPVANSVNPTAAVVEREADPAPPFGNGDAALVVEDDPSVRELARATLERGGFRVFEAPDAQAALQIWNEAPTRISVLVTDMILPQGMSGGRLAQMLQSQDPQLLVVCISGYGAETLRDELPPKLAPGVNFLSKPFEPHALLKAIKVSQARQHAEATRSGAAMEPA